MIPLNDGYLFRPECNRARTKDAKRIRSKSHHKSKNKTKNRLKERGDIRIHLCSFVDLQLARMKPLHDCLFRPECNRALPNDAKKSRFKKHFPNKQVRIIISKKRGFIRVHSRSFAVQQTSLTNKGPFDDLREPRCFSLPEDSHSEYSPGQHDDNERRDQSDDQGNDWLPYRYRLTGRQS